MYASALLTSDYMTGDHNGQPQPYIQPKAVFKYWKLELHYKDLIYLNRAKSILMIQNQEIFPLQY